MKRMTKDQIHREAADIIEFLICRHGQKSLNRLTLAIRRQAR